jgi:hypothetical protein
LRRQLRDGGAFDDDAAKTSGVKPGGRRWRALTGHCNFFSHDIQSGELARRFTFGSD